MGRRPSPCGTYAAYDRHMRNGEKPCEPCRLAMQRTRADYRARNRDKIKERSRLDWLKFKEERRNRPSQTKTARRGVLLKKYGLTPEQHDAMFAAQGNCCALCGTGNPGRHGWHTDHDHALGTTAVRGILCERCNLTLGRIGDSLSEVQRWAEKAVRYLSDYESRRDCLLARVKQIA